ncbi:GDYXXLXY domain-containing protein [Roseateles sp. SL47]|uniref:GDYXXLXY domain-containing protein n=1 Tax=Roseateles sp. SL47 TaxID=2995138 RepID=UPI00226F25FE|nr:GDYXXLXY domain-containing protein [Roseateles sp. SL47]WAC73700.1 GDYXXLXY domain-containing protein [Roseateles sp. SL47]
MHEAQAQGLIAGGASAVSPRPWPVVALTGLAAWIAVVPLVGALALLFGASWAQGPNDYFVGLLMTGLGVTLLRGQQRSLFLEQLGVPLLLTGLVSLLHALDRSLSDPQLEAAGLLMSVVLIKALPLSWMRQLLGAAAAVLVMMLLWHVTAFEGGALEGWAQVHAAIGIGLGLMAAQHRIGGHARGARWAAVMEPALSGWWVVLLLMLMWLAGAAFLVSGSLSIHSWAQTEGARTAGGIDWARATRGGVSAALVLAGAGGLVRAWRPAQAWRLLPPVAVIAAVATQMPVLGGSVVVLALMLATRRWTLALLAAVAALWVLGSFYYSWQLPLQDKAWVMVGAGALLAAWARWMAVAAPALAAVGLVGALQAQAAHGTSGASGAQCAEGVQSAPGVPSATCGSSPAGIPAPLSPAPRRWALAAIGAFGLLVLITVNLLILQKEQLIDEGQPVFVRLAPVDPRSLMQGDYMRLSYALPGLSSWRANRLLWGQRPRVAATLDARGIVQTPRLLQPGEAVPAGMVLLELSPSGSGWTFVTDAWYFRQGEEQRWSAARYGEFRLLPDGRALLVNLVGEDLRPL